MACPASPGSRRGIATRFRFAALEVFAVLILELLTSCAVFADDPKVCIMNPDGSGMHTLVEMPGYSWVGSPSFSHDGKQVAFDGTRDNFENDHVFVIDAAGGEPRDTGLGSRPTWSADDKQLCFFMLDGNPSDEKRGIYVMNTDGKSRQFVVAGTKGSWSPDGSRIAYIEKQDNVPKTIWIYNLLEGQNKVLLKEKFNSILSSPAWSPDGKQICFTGRRQRNGEEELCVVDLEGDGTAATKLKGSLTQNSPGWAPGNRILFVMTPAGQTSPQPHWLDPSLSDPPTAIDFGAGSFWDPCWAPDMKQIAFRFVP